MASVILRLDGSRISWDQKVSFPAIKCSDVSISALVDTFIGPDIFVMRNGARPLKNSWTNRRMTSPDDPDQWLVDDTRRPFTRLAKRGGDESYDFRTRKYGKTDKYTWTDAFWMQPTGTALPRSL
jgi:hypothetical protein